MGLGLGLGLVDKDTFKYMVKSYKNSNRPIISLGIFNALFEYRCDLPKLPILGYSISGYRIIK